MGRKKQLVICSNQMEDLGLLQEGNYISKEKCGDTVRISLMRGRVIGEVSEAKLQLRQ